MASLPLRLPRTLLSAALLAMAARRCRAPPLLLCAAALLLLCARGSAALDADATVITTAGAARSSSGGASFPSPALRFDTASEAEECDVSSGADGGPGSLRAALADPSCDVITIRGGTTILLSSQLEVMRSVQIRCAPDGESGSGSSGSIFDSLGGSARASSGDVAGVTASAAAVTSGADAGATGRCVIDGGGAVRLLLAPAAAPRGLTLTLVGLTLKNGAAKDNTANVPQGGGVYMRTPGSTLTLRDCTLLNNAADLLGGAVRLRDARSDADGIALRVIHTLFDRNAAGSAALADFAQGGAVSAGAHSRTRVESSLFKRNTATAIFEATGGALDVFGGDVDITHSVFEDNAAVAAQNGESSGGAVNAISACRCDAMRIAMRARARPGFAFACMRALTQSTRYAARI
jgi:hypothetical protein